jgi:murein DD-endopeptidase MepM/ murein hydrolase activator NlpD
MAGNEKQKNSSWRQRYRFLVINDVTFEEVFRFRLSKMEAVLAFSGIVLIIVAAVVSLIAFTNLRELIPGYPSGSMRRNIVMNAYRLDSLQNELDKRDRYFEVIQAIVSGHEPDSTFTSARVSQGTNNISFNTSVEDSLMRLQIEKEEKYNLSVAEQKNNSNDISSLFFMPPVKGIVVQSFNALENHLGTDIVTGPNELVKAVLDGTVISAGWTLETGYVIQIQHANDLVSVYKHNQELLKETGNFVKAGEAIAIVGNSGEQSTGPHLHFELWYKGTPLNPEDYIVF